MASKSHGQVVLVLIVSLKCVLCVAVRLLGIAGWNSRLKSVVYFEHHIKTRCTDAMSEGSPCLMISSS